MRRFEVQALCYPAHRRLTQSPSPNEICQAMAITRQQRKIKRWRRHNDPRQLELFTIAPHGTADPAS